MINSRTILEYLEIERGNFIKRLLSIQLGLLSLTPKIVPMDVLALLDRVSIELVYIFV